MKILFKYFYITSIIFFTYLTKAHAYLDPGTGSIVLQAILGILAAMSAGFLYYWTKVKNFFFNLFTKKPDDKK